MYINIIKFYKILFYIFSKIFLKIIDKLFKFCKVNIMIQILFKLYK